MDVSVQLIQLFGGIVAKLNSPAGNEICKNAAGFVSKICSALQEEGFSRSEAIQLICRFQDFGGGK